MNFLYLNSDQMGQGDPTLGRKLLVSFLAELAKSEVAVDAVGCVNDGIRLTTEDGPALDALRALAAKGARVMTCGTCLDHHGRREGLLLGEIGNMAGTVQVLATAARVIRPC